MPKRENPDRPFTPAEKQARYRQKADRLRGLLYSLERAVWEASDRGDPVAEEVKAGDVETMLERLVRHFETGDRLS